MPARYGALGKYRVRFASLSGGSSFCALAGTSPSSTPTVAPRRARHWVAHLQRGEKDTSPRGERCCANQVPAALPAPGLGTPCTLRGQLTLRPIPFSSFPNDSGIPRTRPAARRQTFK